MPASPAAISGLTVGHVDDPAEQNADARAEVALDRLRRHPEGADAAPHRALAPGPLDRLRRAPVPAPAARIGRSGGVLDVPTSARIDALRSSGAPLADPVRQRMEHAFGVPLNHVRLHEGQESARLNAELSAQAFTSGDDIFFGGSGLDPTVPAGERVLAHEIAHVLDPADRTDTGVAPARREPITLEKPVDGAVTYTDTAFPHLRLARLFETGHAESIQRFEVLNDGDLKRHVLRWTDELEYVLEVGAGEFSPVDLIAMKRADVSGIEPQLRTEYKSIGETGWGVTNVESATRLHTSGLITCMAWVLSNDHAAYMTHIVITDPLAEKPDGLAAQVESLADTFTEKSGARPTNLTLQAAQSGFESQYGGKRELTDWMRALVPAGVLAPKFVVFGRAEAEHFVKPGGTGRAAHWRGKPIKLVKVDRVSRDKPATATPLPSDSEISARPKYVFKPRNRTPTSDDTNS